MTSIPYSKTEMEKVLDDIELRLQEVEREQAYLYSDMRQLERDFEDLENRVG